MRNSFKNGLAVAILAFLPAWAASAAEPVTYEKTTVIRQVQKENEVIIDFMKFDVDGDGILTVPEVGDRLFFIFDTDGNEIIDNIEFDHKNLYTLTPMDKETVLRVDFDGDGEADMERYTYDTFIAKTDLSRFDADNDGLSAREFIEKSFLEMDDNGDKAIDRDEWREEYVLSLAPPSAEPERYNN